MSYKIQAAPRPGYFTVALLSMGWAAGCNTVPDVVVANNTPPLIVLVQPELDDEATPVAFIDDVGLAVIVQVEDTQDDFDELEITWTAFSTELADGGTLLAQTEPDATGRSELLVLGLGQGLWHLKVEVEDSAGALESVDLPLNVSPSNYPPALATVELSPDPGFESSVLTCTGLGWSDADDDEPGWIVAWYRDDILLPDALGQTLDGLSFDRGDTITCELTPFDGLLFGEPVLSNSVVIANSPPTVPVVMVTPLPAAGVADDLLCSLITPSEDPDGDPLTDPESYTVSWRVDSVDVSDFDGLWSVPSTATALGEMWTCVVRATDGEDLGDEGVASTPVLPEDGDFVITEFMVEPRMVSAAAGEWIEIYNASGSPMSLLGFVLHDDTGESHEIIADLVVSPAGRVVLGRNADFATNGGVAVDYEYGGVSMAEGVDSMVLSYDGTEVDRVTYDLSVLNDGPGRAHALDPSTGVPSAVVNDDLASWCLAGDLLGGLDSDFGSPGAENGPCACFTSDDDGDGFGDDPSCAETDCDDAEANVFPGGTEVCDGLDNDCLGGVDDGFDQDGDGFTSCGPDGLQGNADDDCNDGEALQYPGNPELCDGLDNNCNSAVDETFDLDGDGVTSCGPDGLPGNSDDDCNDNQPLSYPGHLEVCDAIDNDCDTVVDNGFDQDGDGVTTCGADGIPGSGDDDCDDADPARSPTFVEQCNGIDDDCDWVTDEDFDLDGDGVTTCGPDYNFATAFDNDCNDDPFASGAVAYPGATEACDGVDNDCDGSTDEANAQGCLPWFTDADADTYGVGSPSCLCASVGNQNASQGGDCYDGNSAARPGQANWYTGHRGDGNHDYNCDGQQTKRHTATSGNCALFSDFCSGGTGWGGSPPACGSSGSWRGGCYFSWFSCYWGYNYSRAQECR